MTVIDITRARREGVCIIGAGPAGLITAQILLQDGFENVQLISRDAYVGGVWSRERVYPTMNINNVYGQFRFSSLEMAPPANAEQTGGRLTGSDICTYLEDFANKFLQGKIRFNTEVLNIRRGPEACGWTITVKDKNSTAHEQLYFSRIVLCTGGCSTPQFPTSLTPAAAAKAGFRGPVIHSSEAWTQRSTILACAKPAHLAHPQDNVKGTPNPNEGIIAVVGGGKSAQDIATYLSNEGCNVTVVYRRADMFLARSKPLPSYMRHGRILSILSPSIELKTRMEKFLHTTWLGGKITRWIWQKMADTSFKTYAIPEDSPLRITHSMFWGNRIGDAGLYRKDSYQDLVNRGQIRIVAPAHVTSFAEDGQSLNLSDGQTIPASCVVIATGYSSSWDAVFDDATVDEIGLTIPVDPNSSLNNAWDYTSFSDPPPPLPVTFTREPSVYKGLVPANSILRYDIAVNGAVVTTNSGYAFELCAHWISSYFLGDQMRLPKSVDEAIDQTKRNVAWMKRRYPETNAWMNASYASTSPFFSWPQAMDDLLEDMYLPSMRSGGNWLTWLAQPVNIDELSNLSEERRQKRNEPEPST